MTKIYVGIAVLALSLGGCSKGTAPGVGESGGAPARIPTPAVANPAAVAESATVATGAPAAAARAVKAEMRNVLFHLTDPAAARLESLSGELWPTGKNEMPVFDDKNSFEVRVANGTVSITPEALASIMNSHVFARSDSPVKEISIRIDDGRLIIKGKLHSKGDIPFETAGTVSTTEDGRLRVHTEKMKALHVPLKGVMGVFGIELANVVNTSKIDGMDTDKNDVLLDLGTLLPPPHIRGKVTGVRVEKNAIVTIFGDGGKSMPAAMEKGGYMSFQGNQVRFGKLLMANTDLTVLDLDPGATLDWSQDHYMEQMEAGYSKITANFGLRAYVKDYGKLGKAVAEGAPGN